MSDYEIYVLIFDLLLTMIVYVSLPLAISTFFKELTNKKINIICVSTAIFGYIFYCFLFFIVSEITYEDMLSPNILPVLLWSWIANKLLRRYNKARKEQCKVITVPQITCKNCGQLYPATLSKCVHCGHTGINTMCSYCNKSYDSSYSSCPFCGNKESIKIGDSVTAQVISPVKLCYTEEITVTPENIELFKKWYDREKHQVYILESFKEGKQTRNLCTKKMYESTKKEFEAME